MKMFRIIIEKCFRMEFYWIKCIGRCNLYIKIAGGLVGSAQKATSFRMAFLLGIRVLGVGRAKRGCRGLGGSGPRGPMGRSPFGLIQLSVCLSVWPMLEVPLTGLGRERKSLSPHPRTPPPPTSSFFRYSIFSLRPPSPSHLLFTCWWDQTQTEPQLRCRVGDFNARAVNSTSKWMVCSPMKRIA